MQNDNQNPLPENETFPEAHLDDVPPVDPYDPPPANQNNIPTKPKHSKKKLILIVLSVILVLGSAAAAYVLFTKDSSTPQNQTTLQTSSTAKPEETDPLLQKFINPTTGETWLDAPKPIAKQPFLKEQPDDNTEYYEVGRRGDKTILMSATTMLGDVIYLYEKSPNGMVTFIARPDSQAVYNEEEEKYFGDIFSPDVKVNKEISYDSLSMPRQIDLEKGYKLSKPTYASLGSRKYPQDPSDKNTEKITEIRKLGRTALFRTEYSYADTNLTSIRYGITTPLQTEIGVDFVPFDVDAKKYQWSKGQPYTDTEEYKPITRGCGIGGSVVSRVNGLSDSETVQVGKSADGLAIYEYKDPNHIVVKKAYDEFKQFYEEDTTNPNRNMTKQQFDAQHAVILHKDQFGQWLVYVGTRFAPEAGCAKPVVYLYPTAPTQVSVRVGADVKISEPLYNPTLGWSAFARPNGQLTVNGTNYGSLFWEGPGIGHYPSIDSGTIVKRQDAPATIHHQLIQLGLNSREIKDFEDYWLEKLPNKPYVRLTWLTTAELNRLAPLYITPKPDTVIRVFLDFAGYDKPFDLPPQRLSSIPRHGFTVVEWGGLSPTKLY